MVSHMGKLEIDLDTCTQCGVCIDICPGNALEQGDEGPELAHPELCTQCGACEDQCPSHSITVSHRQLLTMRSERPVGSATWSAISEEIVTLLGLAKPPVGVGLVRAKDEVPHGFIPVDTPLRHCISVHMASLGAALYVPGSQHACSAGKAALGIAELPEKVRSGKIPYMHWLASSEEAASRIMAEIPKLPVGSCVGSIVGPLSHFPIPPAVVVLICRPKQAMWVANALLFRTGGPRISANFAGMQASCGDVTALPIITGNVNFSLGCYGCRSAGKLKDDEMYVGIPAAMMDEVASGLRGLQKAMGRLEHTH